MFAGRKTPRGVVAQTKKRVISPLGERRAFGACGKLMLSTGPHAKYLGQVYDAIPANDVRAEFQAAAFEATRINDTPVGDYVFGKTSNIYEHFAAIYPLPKDLNKRNRYIYEVEAFVSRSLVCASHGRVYTAVCGANKQRIFYREETPAMAEDIPRLIVALLKEFDDDITHVNEIPIEKIRKLYEPGNYDAAYRLICLGELRLLLHCSRKADLAGQEDVARWFLNEYLERKELYLVERKDTWAGDKRSNRPIFNLTAKERYDRRQKKLWEHALKTLAALKSSIGSKAPAAPKAPITLSTIRGKAAGLR